MLVRGGDRGDKPKGNGTGGKEEVFQKKTHLEETLKKARKPNGERILRGGS